MPTYYLYLQDGSGHILRRLDLKFEQDEEAIGWAKEHGGRGEMELWQEGRRVEIFPPDPRRQPR